MKSKCLCGSTTVATGPERCWSALLVVAPVDEQGFNLLWMQLLYCATAGQVYDGGKTLYGF